MARLNSGGGLIARVAALEGVADLPVTLTSGVTTTLSGTHPLAGNHSTVVALTAPYRYRPLRVRFRLRGNGGGGAGSTNVRGVVYDDSGLTNLPTAALVSQSTALAPTNPTGEVTYEFDFPDDAVGEAGAISAGILADLAPTNQAITIPYTTAAANSTLQNDDTYSNGAATPFGTLTSGFSWLPFVELDIEPAAVQGFDAFEDAVSEGTDLTELNASTGLDLTVTGARATIAVDSTIAGLDARVDDLEAGGAGGGIITAVETVDPLDPSEAVNGAPIDTGAVTGGVFLIGSSVSNVAGTLHLEDSPNGTSWTVRFTGATVAVAGGFAANGTCLTQARYVRVRYVNGGTIQASFELVSGYSVTE